jgi:hypothetical protein
MLHKYRHWAPSRASDADQDVRAVSPFSPLILASSAATCSNKRAGHTGHPYYFLPDAAANTPPPLLNNPLSSSLLGSDLRICARQSTPFELCEAQSILHAFIVEPTARGRSVDLPSFLIPSCNRGPTGRNLVFPFSGFPPSRSPHSFHP